MAQVKICGLTRPEHVAAAVEAGAAFVGFVFFPKSPRNLTPEAADGGPIARIRDGDVIRLDAVAGPLQVLVDPVEWAARPSATADLSANEWGVGRELFATFRRAVGSAEQGASSL